MDIDCKVVIINWNVANLNFIIYSKFGIFIQFSAIQEKCPIKVDMSYVVVLSWALSTPQTISIVELDWECSHLVSNCGSRRSSFQVTQWELRCKRYKGSKLWGQC